MSNNIEEMMNNLTSEQLKTINNFKGFMEGITGTKLNNIPNNSIGLEAKKIFFEEPTDFTTLDSNIEEDIKIVFNLTDNFEDSEITLREKEAIENLINAYKKNQNIVDKIKDIIDECIPKKQNVITGKEEYTPNTNANSYLTQRILELFEKEE